MKYAEIETVCKQNPATAIISCGMTTIAIHLIVWSADNDYVYYTQHYGSGKTVCNRKKIYYTKKGEPYFHDNYNRYFRDAIRV